MPRDFPTADDVARAIVAAARACQVHPEQILGVMAVPMDQQLMTSRARCYAAYALNRVFNRTVGGEPLSVPPVPKRAIARMVGAPAGSLDSMVASIELRLVRNDLRWWKTKIADTVIKAVVNGMA